MSHVPASTHKTVKYIHYIRKPVSTHKPLSHIYYLFIGLCHTFAIYSPACHIFIIYSPVCVKCSLSSHKTVTYSLFIHNPISHTHDLFTISLCFILSQFTSLCQILYKFIHCIIGHMCDLFTRWYIRLNLFAMPSCLYTVYQHAHVTFWNYLPATSQSNSIESVSHSSLTNMSYIKQSSSQ